jgi:pimeloyl-ACP methyl ester carboxylesterase
MKGAFMLRFLALFLLLPLAAACATAAQARRHAFASDRIAVEVRGSGPDVVLIPGLSSSPRVWDGTVAAVPGYRYHLVRVAGFDGAAPAANEAGPVVAPVAEEIARYIREARLRRPAIVGHSLGGSWAMMVAARHPELASKIMVVDMLPFLGALFGPPGATPGSVVPVAAQIRQGIASGAGEQRRRTIEQTIAGMVKTPNARAGPIEQSLASDPAVSGQAMYDLITTDLRPELKAVKVPMTVLWVVPPNAPVGAAQMAGFYRISYANVPQAVLKQIPDSYHFIMLDQPAAFQAELRAFLK